MIRRLSQTLPLLLALASCDRASDLEDKANKAQQQADQRIAGMKANTREDIREVQAGADAKIASSEASFRTMREDYRHETTLKLVELDKKVADLDAKATTLSGTSRADLQARLKMIQASRGVFLEDYKSLDTVTGASWDATKARLDREWSDLSALVDKG
jgi:hypothetical protein